MDPTMTDSQTTHYEPLYHRMMAASSNGLPNLTAAYRLIDEAMGAIMKLQGDPTARHTRRDHYSVVRDDQFIRGEKAGFSWAAQIAFDQTSDGPQPGTWNDACSAISKLLSTEACK